MLPSIVRTWVPLIVAYLLSLSFVSKLGITSDQLTYAVTLAFAGLYYLAVRVFEVYVHPRFGALLGWTVQPSYPRRDGRHELGASRDAGSAGIRVLLAGAFAVLFVVLTVSTAQAHWPHADRPVVTVPAAASTSVPAPWLGVGAALDCHGVLWVSYSTQVLLGSTWTPEQDRGRVGLEVRDVSGRSQDPRPGGAVGRWGTPEFFGFPPAVSGGEGRLRWAGLAQARANGLHPDLARVFATRGQRVTSVGMPIEEGCPS